MKKRGNHKEKSIDVTISTFSGIFSIIGFIVTIVYTAFTIWQAFSPVQTSVGYINNHLFSQVVTLIIVLVIVNICSCAGNISLIRTLQNESKKKEKFSKTTKRYNDKITKQLNNVTN